MSTPIDDVFSLDDPGANGSRRRDADEGDGDDSMDVGMVEDRESCGGGGVSASRSRGMCIVADRCGVRGSGPRGVDGTRMCAGDEAAAAVGMPGITRARVS